MRVTAIDTFVVDAGWRPWQFVAVRTDAGITGYGECSDGRMPYSVVDTAQEFETILKGKDPRPVEARYWDMYRMARQSPGGIAAKAIAGVELALWDIKAKVLGVPVYELFGGPIRTRQRVYWSHCGSSRAGNHEIIGVPPLKTWQDITDLGHEVVARGFTALKTNIIYPGETARTYRGGFGGGDETTDGTVDNAMLDHIRTLIGTFRDAVGPHVDIALDLNFNFRVEGAKRICRALEDMRMMWVEVDMYEPNGLREVRESTSVTICSGENLFTARDYRRYFEARSMDVCMVDRPVEWLRELQARRRDGRDVRNQLRAAQLLQPPVHTALATPVRSHPECPHLRDRHRRRPMERRSRDGTPRVRQRPRVDPGSARMGRRPQRGGRARARLGTRATARLLDRVGQQVARAADRR